MDRKQRGSVALGTAHTHDTHRSCGRGWAHLKDGKAVGTNHLVVIGERECGGERAISNGIPLHMAAFSCDQEDGVAQLLFALCLRHPRWSTPIPPIKKTLHRSEYRMVLIYLRKKKGNTGKRERLNRVFSLLFHTPRQFVTDLFFFFLEFLG